MMTISGFRFSFVSSNTGPWVSGPPRPFGADSTRQPPRLPGVRIPTTRLKTGKQPFEKPNARRRQQRRELRTKKIKIDGTCGVPSVHSFMIWRGCCLQRPCRRLYRINFAAKRTEGSNLAGPNVRDTLDIIRNDLLQLFNHMMFPGCMPQHGGKCCAKCFPKDLYWRRQRASYQLRPFLGIQTLCIYDSSANRRHSGTGPAGKTTWIPMKETHRKTLNKIQRGFGTHPFPMDQPFCMINLVFWKALDCATWE